VADDSPKNVVHGSLGHLPPWPRKALNSSVVAMEQAYRQRKDLPLLSEEEIRALKAGEPMPWEFDSGTSLEPKSSLSLISWPHVEQPMICQTESGLGHLILGGSSSG
jgi:hypothetical protein